MSSILITGGTGSFGRAFVYRLLQEKGYSRICIYSRGEHTQAAMREELEKRCFDAPDRLRWFIGDVRDRDRLRRAMRGCRDVVHAAALKRIEVGHYNPIEMVRTNIDGAVNVIEASQDLADQVRRVVMLSTDKAYQPVSPYGQSKALAESLFLAANEFSQMDGPSYAVTRYGNVWRSAGSVVPIWEEISKVPKGKVTLTDPDCTRFYMTMNQACELVLEAIDAPPGLIVPDLPAYRLGDLLVAMRLDDSLSHTITGLPAWEKMHESMDIERHSNQARRMTVDDLRVALLTQY